MSKARVIIVDDHAIVRRGLAQILAEEPDIEVMGEAADASELFTLLKSQSCDVMVLDITMPGKSGLEILKDLRKSHPSLPVLILSIHPEDQYAVRALRAGAAGYITKESAPEELVQAIRRVLAGKKYLSPSTTDRMASLLAKDVENPLHAALSDREFEVMILIASGKTVSAIAGELCLSDKTVSTYRARVLGKLGLENNMEITRYAFKNRLID